MSVDLSKLKRYSLKNRPSKVKAEDLAKPMAGDFLSSLPSVLKAGDFKKVVKAIKQAQKNQKRIIWLLGGHNIKIGLSPVYIDLIKRGFVSHIAVNGAVPIHDWELAFNGQTSENVEQALKDGSFGMAKETGQIINQIINRAAKNNQGLGESIGQFILNSDYPNKNLSLLASAIQNKISVSVHSALGAEIIHHHPEADGAAIGQTSLQDFHTLIEQVSQLEDGVVINVGSAVILPEVFLKALTTARNLGHKVNKFTAVNFDMNNQYRALNNIIKRPTQNGGQGFSFVGHNEIMIPLLYQELII